ncbi:MAG: hypothetical protein WED09_00010 [Homoserinimonas sp.]
MPIVSVTVEVQVEIAGDPDAIDPIEVERAVRAEGQRAARELYGAALGQIEQVALATSGAPKQRREQRWVSTTFGRMRIDRYRVADPACPHPLDRLMSLGRSEATIGMREAICDLALRLPYRQVAEVVSSHTGQVISHQSAWRVLRGEGARVRTEEGELVDAIFVNGEAPDTPDVIPELVVLEADGTFLRSQGEPLDRFEVKTGVAYTGKVFDGGKAHRRYRLKDKHCYATTADADRFGQGFAAGGFIRLGLHRVPNMLCAHDGLDAYGATFADWFPGAHHQIDHFHVAKRIWELAGADQAAFARMRPAAFADPIGFARALRAGRIAARSDLALEIAGYLEHVGPDLHGIDKIPAHLRQGRMHIVGSGVVEKHQDILVNRRMKHRGMRWSKKGADALLALQARRFSSQWNQLWEVKAA